MSSRIDHRAVAGLGGDDGGGSDVAALRLRAEAARAPERLRAIVALAALWSASGDVETAASFFGERLRRDRVDAVKAAAAGFAAVAGCADALLQHYALSPFVRTRRVCLAALTARSAVDPRLRDWLWTAARGRETFSFDVETAACAALAPAAGSPEVFAWLLEKAHRSGSSRTQMTALRVLVAVRPGDDRVRAAVQSASRLGLPGSAPLRRAMAGATPRNAFTPEELVRSFLPPNFYRVAPVRRLPAAAAPSPQSSPGLGF